MSLPLPTKNASSFSNTSSTNSSSIAVDSTSRHHTYVPHFDLLFILMSMTTMSVVATKSKTNTRGTRIGMLAMRVTMGSRLGGIRCFAVGMGWGVCFVLVGAVVGTGGEDERSKLFRITGDRLRKRLTGLACTVAVTDHGGVCRFGWMIKRLVVVHWVLSEFPSRVHSSPLARGCALDLHRRSSLDRGMPPCCASLSSLDVVSGLVRLDEYHPDLRPLRSGEKGWIGWKHR